MRKRKPRPIVRCRRRSTLAKRIAHEHRMETLKALAKQIAEEFENAP